MGGLQAWLAHAWPVRGSQITIGVLFAIAGLAKIGDLRSFAEQIHNFRILPIAAENVMAMTLPWIEIVCALALVSGVRARAGSLLALGLLVVFTVALALALARGLDIECGCFGTADASRVGVRKVLENVGMLVLAWVGTLRRR